MMGIRDPCGDEEYFMHLFAMYVKHLQFGVNYEQDGPPIGDSHGIRSGSLLPVHAEGISFPLRPK